MERLEQIKHDLERLKKIKILYAIIDEMDGFMVEGALADTYIQHIVPGTVEKLEEVKAIPGGDYAIFKDMHPKGCLEHKRIPPHTEIGTKEARLVAPLRPYEPGALVYEKNAICGIFAPGFLPDLSKMENLQEVWVAGDLTDYCVHYFAAPLVSYFDQNNRDVKVVVFKDLVETFQGPDHEREECNQWALKFMRQVGVQVR